MIPLQKIKYDKDKTLELLDKRGFDGKEKIDALMAFDEKRKGTQQQLDDKLSESKKISKAVGEAFKAGNEEEGAKLKTQSTQLKEEIQKLQEDLREYQNAIRETQIEIPNIPHPDVPKGFTEEENEEVKRGGGEAKHDPNSRPHWELAETFDIINFEAGNKVTGAGFPVYKGKGAKLQRAMINYFLEESLKAGYEEYQPPLLVNEHTGFGTGQLPDKEGQMYQVERENLFLIPTSEVPLTNLYRDTIVNEKDLPLKLTAYTPCFRREAGSYGKEVRGLNRLHQFDKVEIVQINHPDRSYETLNEMIQYVEYLVQQLGLPYRVLKLCGGDLGFAAAITYDIEVYAPAQDKWLEVSSISNFEDFQSNRLQLRFRDQNNKNRLAHTLNGSALAFPRLLAALMEFYQTPSGIDIPEPLAKHCGFNKIQNPPD